MSWCNFYQFILPQEQFATAVTEELISKTPSLKNLPSPLFAKEGDDPSLWQREVRRDFIINVFILMTLLLNKFLTMSYYSG
jgi:hypothetical protein